MYTIEEFDKEKTRVLKYIMFKKRSEYEVRNKFSKTIDEDLLEDIIEYLKEAGYINDKEYIVDCTYRQFFRLENNNIDRLGVIGLCGCDPGVFMMQNRERKNVALAILKNGWVRCTEDNFKHYLDGFTLSFRNGLYYDWLGKVDYSVGYSASDYLEFLNEDDFITNYEPLEGLGEQEEPLKNRSLRFRKK